MLLFLNSFFHVTHIAAILFLMVGWIFVKTRKAHLVLLSLTIFSWIGLGIFYGWGYCFWTDWHWRVRDLLGKSHPASYIKLLVDSFSGRSWNANIVDLFTAITLAIIILFTAAVNFKSFKRAA
jgi:Protein of Unknown function (DUF2784)